MVQNLQKRAIRTLAWLGDAEFEREVRLRVAQRGDYPVDRLDMIRAAITRAEAQADLLAAIEADLHPEEHDVVRRGKNAAVPVARRDTKSYRAATGLEALIAHWTLGGEAGQRRLRDVLLTRLEGVIDATFEAVPKKPKRG